MPLGEYDIAHLFEIERYDVGLSGRQDRYAATRGRELMEFATDRSGQSLRVKNWIISELETSIVLFYTGASRSSASIIDEQTKNIGWTAALEAMHHLKQKLST